MLANAKKSAVVKLSKKRGKQDDTTPTLKLDTESIPTLKMTKFLGVTIDEHLNFSQHVDNITKKGRSLTYVLLDLKRSGIPRGKLFQFYTSCIRPALTYAAAAWYKMTSKENRKKTESVERLALKIIAPELESYEDRLERCGIPPIEAYINNQAIQHMLKVKDKRHCLHHLLPEQQSRSLRHSKRLEDRYIQRPKTEMRRNSFICHYVNNFNYSK